MPRHYETPTLTEFGPLASLTKAPGGSSGANPGAPGKGGPNLDGINTGTRE